MRIVIDPVKYKAYLRAKRMRLTIEHYKKEIMEASAELLLEHTFRRSDMNGEDRIQDLPLPEARLAQGTSEQPKAFGLIVKDLTAASALAKQLSMKSGRLISLYISTPQKKAEEEKDEAVQSAVLIHVLQKITSDLNLSLLEISNNLEELEKAW